MGVAGVDRNVPRKKRVGAGHQRSRESWAWVTDISTTISTSAIFQHACPPAQFVSTVRFYGFSSSEFHLHSLSFIPGIFKHLSSINEHRQETLFCMNNIIRAQSLRNHVIFDNSFQKFLLPSNYFVFYLNFSKLPASLTTYQIYNIQHLINTHSRQPIQHSPALMVVCLVSRGENKNIGSTLC